MPRIQSIDEVLAVSLQTGEGFEATPATADVFAFIDTTQQSNQENLEREDKGLGRSFFGFVRGGNSTPDGEINSHILTSAAATPVTAPPIASLLRGAMGATPSNVNTTISDTTPSASSFDVASATGISQGDPLSAEIGSAYEIRPVSNVSGTTLTFSPAFSAAPADGATVKAEVYRLAGTLPWFTVVDYLRETDLTIGDASSKLVDAVVNELVADWNQSVTRLTARLMAKTWSRTSLPSIPTLPDFTAQVPQARNFGGAWVDATSFSAFEMQLTLSNNGEQITPAVGSSDPDTIVFGQRRASINLLVEGVDTNVTNFLANAESKTAVALFFHLGDDEGRFFAINMPSVTLSLDPYEKGTLLQLRFATSAAAATAANNELVLACA